MTQCNQKCTVRSTKISNTEPQAKANAFYKAIAFTCPLYIERSNGLLIPHHCFPKTAQKTV